MAKQKPAKVEEKKQQASESQITDSAAWWSFVLAILSFLVFATGFQNGMVSMDDHSATVDNPAVTEFNLFGHFNLGMYAPVTWGVYGIAYMMGKDQAFWYHLLSALIHALNVYFLFRVLRLMSLPAMSALLVCFLFALHPIQVEAVSWIAAMSTPLAVLFMLLSYAYYLRYRKEEGFGMSYWLSLGFFVLAALSKSIAVSVPLSLFVLDFWMSRPINRRCVLEKAPFFVLALGFGILTLYSRTLASHLNTPADFTFFDRALMIFHTLAFYWIKLLIPQGFSIWYPFVKTGGIWPWTYYAAPFMVAGVYWGAYRMRGQFPVLWYGLLFYLVHVVFSLPYATFGTFELRSDRYNYLGSVGIFAIIASLPGYIKAQKPAWEGIFWVLLGILGLGCLVQTVNRIKDWRNTVVLINRAIETSGDNFGKAYLWRGMEYGDSVGRMKDRKLAEQAVNQAVSDFTKALSINPELYEAYKYRGGLYGITKQYAQSVADLNAYLSHNPTDAEYFYNRGLSQLNLRHLPDAISDFSQTIQLKPDFDRAYKARGNAYILMGDSLKGNADLEIWRNRTGATQ